MLMELCASAVLPVSCVRRYDHPSASSCRFARITWLVESYHAAYCSPLCVTNEFLRNTAVFIADFAQPRGSACPTVESEARESAMNTYNRMFVTDADADIDADADADADADLDAEAVRQTQEPLHLHLHLHLRLLKIRLSSECRYRVIVCIIVSSCA